MKVIIQSLISLFSFTFIMYCGGIISGANFHPFYWSQPLRDAIAIIWCIGTAFIVIGFLTYYFGEKVKDKLN